MAEKHQATLPMSERSERRSPPLPKVAPWLVIPYGKGRKNQAFYNLCDPDRRTCRKLVPELSGKTIYQKPCHQGWLLIVCDDDEVDYTPNWNFGDCFIWNPATLETIQLPNVQSSGYTYDEYILADCVLSCPPRAATISTDGGVCHEPMAFFLLERREDENDYDEDDEDHADEYVFLFCRPGDKQWISQTVSLDNKPIRSLHCIKGNIYAMISNTNVSHLKIEMEKIDGGNVSLSLMPFTLSDHHAGFSYIGGIFSSVCETRYVETCDELYRLCLHYTSRSFMKEVISIDIARLDFDSMGWKEVNSLGDNVLFYGSNTTACCSAAELGLTRGCLYYTLPNDQSLYKYELEGTGAGTIILPCRKLPTPWFCSDWIMMPTTFSRVGDGQEKTNKREAENCMMMRLGVKSTSSASKNKEKVYNSGEVNQQRPWSILDKDSIHMITRYLNPIDYKHFRSISKENRSILPLVKQTSTSDRINNVCLSPWMLFSNPNDSSVYNLVDPMHNENYFMKIPLLQRARILFQKGGWLLLLEGDYKLSFHNPFTKEAIELPNLPKRYSLTNISFSSLPICSDCVVFGIKLNSSSSILVYVIARGEKSWRTREFENIDTEKYLPLYNTTALHEGILYSVDYNGVLGAFSLEDGISWSFKVLEKPCGIFSGAHPGFLVECGGDLLLVKLGRMGTFVGIFKMDFSKMEWVRVKSLGKRTLFIGYTSCVSSVAPHTGMENKIYFPRLSMQGQGILFYSLDTHSYHFSGGHHSSTDFYDTQGWSSWSWIEPNWSQSTASELDWFS